MTVAKEIDLKDAMENMGAQMVRRVASKTSDVAGDGTTAPNRAGPGHFSRREDSGCGCEPGGAERGLDKAVERVSREIRKTAKPVTKT